MVDNKVVTRFAPSPTGFMHVGNIRAALYAWLWTKKNKGTFILRIEDTDKEREVEGSKEHIQESLKWLGLDWDEGPGIGGPHAPYFQSERLPLYKQYAQKLINKGLAYADNTSDEKIEELRQKAELEKRPFLFREHRPENPPIWDGTQPLRFKVSVIKSYSWHDVVFGELSAGPEMLDDFILIKSDGYPTYNFAHIVDDIEMGVNLVMRGQEYIASTPKYLSVYEALGIEPPLYACLPHIMAPGGNKKLGKRDGAKDILEYRAEGYLPVAMVNFLAFLGWNPGDEREVFTIDELINSFDISKIQRSGAQLNNTKLDWLNKEHIKKLSIEEINKNILEWLKPTYAGFKEDMLKKLVPVILERISKWGDIKKIVQRGELDFFFKAPDFSQPFLKEKLIFKNTSSEKIKNNLELAMKALEQITEENFNKENIKIALMSIADKLDSRGEVLHPVRFALSGKDQSPDPFIIAEILGKNETLFRLQKAV